MGTVRAQRPQVPHLRPAVLAAAALCLAVAGASLALRAGPQYDPFGWLIWGRELLHGRLDTVWYPSWKPLPVLITTPAALAGHAALPLWLIVSRSVALAGAVVAARLAYRAAGTAGALLAGIGILTLPQWLPLWLSGTIEPLVTGMLLAGVLALLAGRPRAALALLAAASLGRVEAFPLLVLAAAWTWRQGAARLLGPALVVAVPLLWLAGDWAGADDPMHGGWLARLAMWRVRDKSDSPVLVMLAHVPHVIPVPILAAAVATAAWGLLRRRPAESALALVAVVWIITDLVLASRGYPTDPRFLLPAAAATVTLAALGAGRVLAGLRRPALAVAAVAALALLAAVTRAPSADQQVAEAATAHQRLGRLDDAVRWAGGPAGVAACGGAATWQPFRARLAWDLQVSTTEVRKIRHRGLVFAPRFERGFRPPIARGAAVRVRHAGRVGPWDVLRVTPRRSRSAPAQRARCLTHA
jgi:hypothetical protein